MLQTNRWERLETTLYRPVGQKELDLVLNANAFPPRLPHQPFFYPVITEDYAIQIAKDWNTKDPISGYVGYVLKFKVNTAFLDNYCIQQVGGKTHLEFWIPAEDLKLLNENIVGKIEVIAEFRGSAPSTTTV